PPSSPLFPYTTLFRSELGHGQPHRLLVAVRQGERALVGAADLAPQLGRQAPVAADQRGEGLSRARQRLGQRSGSPRPQRHLAARSEEHTSELQSRENL